MPSYAQSSDPYYPSSYSHGTQQPERQGSNRRVFFWKCRPYSQRFWGWHWVFSGELAIILFLLKLSGLFFTAILVFWGYLTVSTNWFIQGQGLLIFLTTVWLIMAQLLAIPFRSNLRKLRYPFLTPCLQTYPDKYRQMPPSDLLPVDASKKQFPYRWTN